MNSNQYLDAMKEGVLYYIVWKGEQRGLIGDNLRVYVVACLSEYGWNEDTISYWVDGWMGGFDNAN